MRKTAILAIVCLFVHFASKAQCNKKIKWSSSKSEFIDTATGNIQRTNNEIVEMTAGPKTVVLVLKGDHSDTMNGDVKDYSCNWQDKQNGKLSFKSVLTDIEGRTRHASITIEAVNGTITALLKAEEEPTTIRLTIDSFNEN